MSDISNQLIKDSYNYVLQSDLSTGIIYRIDGNVPTNPIFSSGLTINQSFKFSDGSESLGYVLTSDGDGNASWSPSSGATTSSGDYLPLSGGTVTGDTIFQSGLTANTITASTYMGGYAHFGSGNPTPYLGGLHNVEITASGNTAPLTLIGGTGGIEVWIDDIPTKAVWFGAATPGIASDGNLHFSTYEPSFGWNDRIVVDNSTGDLGIGTGSPTNRLHVYASSNPIRLEGLTADTSDTNLLSVDGNGVVHTYPLSPFIPPYKIYTALLTQNGGDVQDSQSSGAVTKGVSYTVNKYYVDTDFTNVGGGTNANQILSFVATSNDTPNNYDGSILNFNNGAPVVTVLENTIGNIWFTYGFTGQYIINSDNLFVIDKTINTLNQTSNISSSNDQQYFAYCLPNGESMLTITLLDSTLTNTDDVLYNKLIEIRVYN